MSDDQIGRDLRRAVEAQRIRETPYERSRLARRLDAPARGFPWAGAFATAALVGAVALAAVLVGGRGERTPVAASPTPGATPVQSGVAGSPTLAPTPNAAVRERVYFVRDELPPVGALVETTQKGPSTAESRIRARLEALPSSSAPSGASNAASSLRATVAQVRIEGELVRLDYTVPSTGWGGVGGTSGTNALVQQLVYTASEEPGIRRVLITQNGGQTAEIGGHAVLRAPLTREQVLGYTAKVDDRLAVEGSDAASTLQIAHSVDLEAPGLVSMRITARPTGSAPDFFVPTVSAELRPSTGADGKWWLAVTVAGGRDAQGARTLRVDETPLRTIEVTTAATSTTYTLALDDARPWRIVARPGASPASELYVEIGGGPYAVSDSIAVYGPGRGETVPRELTIRGSARTFEGTVAWRIRDSARRVVASGFTTATVGTSALWGAFETKAAVPAGVSGNLTLEVYWGSPQDGRDLGTVAIPITVR